MSKVFISYARADQGFARDLNLAFQKSKHDIWTDWRSIPDSAEWRAEIFAAIEGSDNFLFIISPDSLRSSMCRQEIDHAIANKKRIITILYHPVDQEELPSGLKEIQWISYPVLGFEATFRRLTTAIDTDMDWVRRHTQFLARAAQWEANGRDNGYLLHGMELKEAIQWLEQSATIKGGLLTKVEQQYIRTSEEWEAGELQRFAELTKEIERWRYEAERLERELLLREQRVHHAVVDRHVLQVFLCHASGDKPVARKLHQRLNADGYRPWLDEKDLIAGQAWEQGIRAAIKMSHIVLVLLSQQSGRKTGFVHKEIKFALDVAAEKPPGVIFLIPLRLDQCDVPEQLSFWQWVDFSQPDG
jgi:hypothetical protein